MVSLWRGEHADHGKYCALLQDAGGYGDDETAECFFFQSHEKLFSMFEQRDSFVV